MCRLYLSTCAVELASTDVHTPPVAAQDTATSFTWIAAASVELRVWHLRLEPPHSYLLEPSCSLRIGMLRRSYWFRSSIGCCRGRLAESELLRSPSSSGCGTDILHVSRCLSAGDGKGKGEKCEGVWVIS